MFVGCTGHARIVREKVAERNADILLCTLRFILIVGLVCLDSAVCDTISSVVIRRLDWLRLNLAAGVKSIRDVFLRNPSD